MDPAANPRPKRRVYATEFKKRLGVGDTWLRTMEMRGQIPSSRVDAGGRRKWWLEDEVDAVVAGTFRPPTRDEANADHASSN